MAGPISTLREPSPLLICMIFQSALLTVWFAAHFILCLFVYFVALRPKSTAMVMAGQSVHLTTLFPGQA